MSLRRGQILVSLGAAGVLVSALLLFFWEEREPSRSPRGAPREKRTQAPRLRLDGASPQLLRGQERSEEEAKGEVRAGLEEKGGYQIVGRVLDSKGHGIVGAKLTFLENPKFGSFGAVFEKQQVSVRKRVMATGVEGRFCCVVEEPLWSTLIVKASPIHSVGRKYFPYWGTKTRRLDLGDIVLSDAVCIRGQVLDPMGLGIAGATIEYSRGFDDVTRASFYSRFCQVVDWKDLTKPLKPPLPLSAPVIVSDERGDFLIENLEPGHYKLFADFDQYRCSETKLVRLYDERSARVSLSLRMPLTLHISVRDEQGRPVPGVTASLSRRDPGFVYELPRLLSSESGELVFKDLEGFQYSIDLRKKGFGRMKRTLSLLESRNQYLNWTLKAECPLRGKVISSRAGEGVEALVSVYEEGEERECLVQSQVKTSKTGHFLVAGLSAGRYGVLVVPKGHGMRRFKLVVPEGAEELSVPFIRVDPVVKVDVLVLDASGKAVESAGVRVTDFGFQRLPQVDAGTVFTSSEELHYTDVRGQVTLKNVVPGTVGFSAESSGWPRAYAEAVEVSEAGAKVTLRFVKEGGGVVGSFFDRNGPKKRGSVGILRRGFRRVEQVTVIEENGVFQFKNMAPGQYKIISLSSDREDVFAAEGFFWVRAGAVTKQDLFERD